jgi:hypothetical protein
MCNGIHLGDVHLKKLEGKRRITVRSVLGTQETVDGNWLKFIWILFESGLFYYLC